MNTENLVNNWGSAASTFLGSTTTLTASGPTTVTYGVPINVTVSVAAAAPATGTPTGDIGIISNSTAPNGISIGEGTLANGTASVAAFPLPIGTYQLLARYAGDATFAPSQSAGGLSITVLPATVNEQLTANGTSLRTGQYITLSLTLPGVTGAMAPTGTATFTDATTGSMLGSRMVTTATDGITGTASVTIAAAQLKAGTNVITASYSGDAHYAASSGATVSIAVTVPFNASVNPGTLAISANGTGAATVTATAVGGGSLDPTMLTFACPSNLAAGLTCTFSTPTAGTNGTVSSTLSLQLANPLVVKSTNPVASNTHKTLLETLLGTGARLACLLVLGGLSRRQRLFQGAGRVRARRSALHHHSHGLRRRQQQHWEWRWQQDTDPHDDSPHL